jgi:cellulose synthase/poly-beta-1,6-N-acetylglucosamine synthase-like glycosyltransferase
MEILFWTSLGAVAWSYLGYPLALLLWSGLADALGALRFVGGGPDRRASPAGPLWPRITIVFSAFDEEQWIVRKVENCLALDYPAEKLEILVGCDGCTDRTAQLAREAGGGRVTVHELSPRAGKAAVLSRLVPLARGDLVVLTDANVMLEPGAAKALARRFRDGAVGAVVGRLRLYNPSRQEFEETLYWRYETTLKYLEGQRGCVLGANGGLYAIRRLLFSPLEPDTVTDDFVVPMRIALRGWRVPFEPGAVAREETTEDAGREFGRRARIGAGNWQALARVQGLLDPRAGFPCFAFVSHKLLRWATPFLLAAALLANVALTAAPGAWGYRAVLAAQLAFYALALLGRTRRLARGELQRAASLAHYFVGMNAALAVGFWRFLRGAQRATWERTARRAA